MKSRTYRTLSGKIVTALRPETAAEVAALETSVEDEKKALDARHSLGDGRELEEQAKETKR